MKNAYRLYLEGVTSIITWKTTAQGYKGVLGQTISVRRKKSSMQQTTTGKHLIWICIWEKRISLTQTQPRQNGRGKMPSMNYVLMVMNEERRNYYEMLFYHLIIIHQVFQPHPCGNHNNYHKDNGKRIAYAERSIIMERRKIMVKCKQWFHCSDNPSK